MSESTTEQTTVWVTRWALSRGIEKVSVGPVSHAGYVTVKLDDGYISIMLKVGKDVFTTEEEAAADAEARRVKKMASLRRQLAKLEGLRF